MDSGALVQSSPERWSPCLRTWVSSNRGESLPSAGSLGVVIGLRVAVALVLLADELVWDEETLPRVSVDCIYALIGMSTALACEGHATSGHSIRCPPSSANRLISVSSRLVETLV